MYCVKLAAPPTCFTILFGMVYTLIFLSMNAWKGLERKGKVGDK